MGLADDPKDWACSGVRLECFRTTVSLSDTKLAHVSNTHAAETAETTIRLVTLSVACVHSGQGQKPSPSRQLLHAVAVNQMA